MQWLLAGALEAFWGTRRYIMLALGCGVAGYLVTALLAFVIPAIQPVAMGGATTMDLAAVVAYGVMFGKRPLHIGGFLPLSSRGLAIAIAVVAVLSPLARGTPWPVVLPWVVSMLTALIITTQPWRRLGNSGKLGGGKRRKASHLKVVRPERKLLN